jgi:SAM-dependent methyltransferase
LTARDPSAGRVPAYAGREKYDRDDRAARYANRSPRRHAEEWRLVERVLDGDPWPATVLDAPCGAGRMAAEMLARGSTVRAADLSPAMRAQCAKALDGRERFQGVVTLDLEDASPPPAWRAELVLCFRFLHHLPGAAARGRVLRTLAALSSDRVLVSFHHPVSAHQVARAVRRVVTGRAGDRHAVTLARLRREAAEAGLSFVRAKALGAGRRDLWAALFTVRPRAARARGS